MMLPSNFILTVIFRETDPKLGGQNQKLTSKSRVRKRWFVAQLVIITLSNEWKPTSSGFSVIFDTKKRSNYFNTETTTYSVPNINIPKCKFKIKEHIEDVISNKIKSFLTLDRV